MFCLADNDVMICEIMCRAAKPNFFDSCCQNEMSLSMLSLHDGYANVFLHVYLLYLSSQEIVILVITIGIVAPLPLRQYPALSTTLISQKLAVCTIWKYVINKVSIGVL